jgi:glycosyltransferase involved in cell wall biosynthesis
MVKLHLLTRCTRLSNLKRIKESVFPSPFNVVWHLIFDTTILKDIDAELLQGLQNTNIRFHFAKGDGKDYLYPQLSQIISELEDGFVGILDDDNIVHPDFYKTLQQEILQNQDKLGFVYEQYIGGTDFTGLEVRKVGPQHMKLRHIDSAQYILHTKLYKLRSYEGGYDADGRFIEPLYNMVPDEFHFIHKVLCYYNHLNPIKKARVPKVLYIGNDEPTLKSINYLGYEDTSLDVRYAKNDLTLISTLTSFKPDSIITVSDDYRNFPNLCSSTEDIRKRWMTITPGTENIGDIAYNCAMNQILEQNHDKLVSYFTPIYNTGEKLLRTYESLREQTYADWEWVIVNDSSDGGKTLKIAEAIAAKDYRVRVYDFREKTKGIIGESKYRAACLTRGKWLAELDHDDLLTDNCTMDIVNAANKFPDAGFIYNDSVEVTEDLRSLTYGEGFSLGYGKYRKVTYRGNVWDVAVTSNINPKTIRHIVGVPNHVRVWRRDVYFQIGGHNRDLAVADDYELIVRTFLHTKFVKIPKLGYIQYIYNNHTGQNTHDLSRADIQRRVRTIMYHYNDRIAQRFEELGVEDYPYKLNRYDPLAVPSRFGDGENYVNYIFEG